MNPEPEKLNGASLDVPSDKKNQLKQLFPTVFTETANEKGELVESVDFEKLKAEIGHFSEIFESRRERYGMDWPGKKDALRLIQTPSTATLKPCREESVNFDTTENLFIEGDNLEVLKLLQKSYYGKVKMIYIDPPYNTGKEFIYPDNYSESLQTYLEYAGLVDSEGKKFSTNTANQGRFHTKWLNMMYPRLYLARNLLRDDGVIFISIDDNEVTNLRILCDEIYGQENFIALLPWKGRGGGADDKNLLENHEYVLMYAKFHLSFQTGRKIKSGELFPKYDEEKKRNYKTQLARKWGSNSRREDRPNLYYPIILGGKEIYPKLPDETDGRWRWAKERMLKAIENHDLEFAKRNDGNWEVYEKIYEPLEGEFRTKLYSAWLQEEVYEDIADILEEDEAKTTAFGTKQLKDLFNGVAYFDFPKPSNLISVLLKIANSNDSDIIFDFFAGSATTAHAVLDLNRQDDGSRKFILVQLPEPSAPETEAFKADFKTISDIGKERIRRVIKKLNEEDAGKLDLHENARPDRGFKVLKLNKSNFKQWQTLAPDASPQQIADQLEMYIDHVDDNATPEELLYEILIKAGFRPTEKVENISLAGIPVFSIANGDLLICLADQVTKELVDALVQREPLQFICLDSAFHGNDQLKANIVQTFASRNMGREKANQIIFKTI